MYGIDWMKWFRLVTGFLTFAVSVDYISGGKFLHGVLGFLNIPPTVPTGLAAIILSLFIFFFLVISWINSRKPPKEQPDPQTVKAEEKYKKLESRFSEAETTISALRTELDQRREELQDLTNLQKRVCGLLARGPQSLTTLERGLGISQSQREKQELLATLGSLAEEGKIREDKYEQYVFVRDSG